MHLQVSILYCNCVIGHWMDADDQRPHFTPEGAAQADAQVDDVSAEALMEKIMVENDADNFAPGNPFFQPATAERAPLDVSHRDSLRPAAASMGQRREAKTDAGLVFAGVGVKGESGPDLFWLEQAERPCLPNQDLSRLPVDVLLQKGRARFPQQAAQQARRAVDEIDEPIFGVGRIGPGANQIEGDDVSYFDRSPVGISHVTQ